MKKPSILEIRFGKAMKNQKKLSLGELQREVDSADKVGADKFKRDCFSVFLKNNNTNAKRYGQKNYFK